MYASTMSYIYLLTLHDQVLEMKGVSARFDRQKSWYNARRLLVKLSENGGILPPSLTITGVENCEKEPVAGGGFADIFRASYKGEVVALKRLRDFQIHQERQVVHRVRYTTSIEMLLRLKLAIEILQRSYPMARITSCKCLAFLWH